MVELVHLDRAIEARDNDEPTMQSCVLAQAVHDAGYTEYSVAGEGELVIGYHCGWVADDLGARLVELFDLRQYGALRDALPLEVTYLPYDPEEEA